MEPRRLLVRVAYLLDLAQSESDGPAVTAPLASRTGAPYSTVRQLDTAYAELGRALDEWKASL